MALWCENEKPLKITFARKEMGLDVYLYLPGPSLSVVDFDVRTEGTMAFAINTAYPRVKPHIWVGMDKPECYDPRLMYEGFPKIFRGSYFRQVYRGKSIKEYPQTYFADLAKPQKGIEDMFLLNGDDVTFVWFKHTLAVVLHTILWMGGKKIHFVGCDLGGKKDYHDDRVLSDEQRVYNRLLYDQQATFLKEFTSIGEKYGVECISCTPESPINDFMPYRKVHEAISDSKAVVGPTRDVKHALEVEENELEEITDSIKWKEPIRERGVLVMCDKNQEWMLGWWFDNYIRHNHLPIQFVDIGMTEGGVRFCKARGSYVKMKDVPLKNWFKKPFALKLSQFKRTVYMDVDCEVRGSIFHLYKKYPKGFVISKDLFTKQSPGKDPVNSGVIIFNHADSIIDKWGSSVIKNHTMYRGDQECLDLVRYNYVELSPVYNWTRVMGDNSNALIFHYVGAIGKEFIKKQI